MRNKFGSQLLLVMIGGGLLTLFAVVVLTQPLVVQGFLFAVTLLGVGFVAYPKHAATALVAGQVLVGMLHWVNQRVAGLNILELYGGLASVGFVLLLVVNFRRLLRAPWLLVAVGYLLILGTAAMRTTSAVQGVGEFVRFASPIIVMYVMYVYCSQSENRRRLLWTLVGAGSVVLVVSIYVLVLGQMANLSVAGIERLRGGFHHTSVQGQVMAMFCAVGVLAASTTKRERLRNIMAMYAVACAAGVYLSHSRTAAVGLLVFWLSWLAVKSQWRWFWVSMTTVVVVMLSSSFLQGRFDDLVLLAQLDPLQADLMRDVVGSGRLKIWRLSLYEFSLRSPLEWMLGVGLGEHRMLYLERVDVGMASHNDFLALFFQAGVAGFLAYLSLLVGVFRLSLSHRNTPLGAFVVALIMMAIAMNAMSNAYVSRVNLSWVLFAFFGAIMGAHRQTEARS
jgi:hypothetical protein